MPLVRTKGEPFKHEMEMTVWRAVCGTPDHPVGMHANRVLFRNIQCELELDTDMALADLQGKLYRVTIEEVPWPTTEERSEPPTSPT